jgi:hypothetical protein
VVLLLPWALEVCAHFGEHQPEETARKRPLFQPVAACTRAQSARRTSGLTTYGL